MSWTGVSVSGEPVLVVGLRDQKGTLEGFRVNVETDVHPDLRRVATDALGRVRAMTAVPYTPYVGQDEGEYLSISPDALIPKHRPVGDDTPTEKSETAALVSLVRQADVLPEIGAGDLIGRVEDELYVQIVCLKENGHRIGFVTKASRRQILKRSAIPLGRNDQNDRLKRITRPELVLEPDVHAIVRSDEVAILNRSQFQFLVSDTNLVVSYAPAQVKRITQGFTRAGVTLAQTTQDALATKAAKSIQVAKRLDVFAERVGEVDVKKLESGEGFTAQDLAPDDFVNDRGEIDCGEERVVELLDALEGRFFRDAFSPERRRADRFRRR